MDTPKPAGATFGFGDIVARLEHQRDAIVAALNALREIGGVAAPSPAPDEKPMAVPKSKRKRRLTPEGRERLIAALKRRWAAKKAKSKLGRPKKAR